MIPTITLHNGLTLHGDITRQMLWAGVDSGVKWLAALPTMVEGICQEYGITLSTLLPELSMNLVFFGHSPRYGEVVLKLAPPHQDIANEIAMVTAMQGHGYAKLIAANDTAMWMLQKRVSPGRTLQSFAQRGEISDADATRIAARLIKHAHAKIPAGHSFPDLNRWLKSLWDYPGIYGENGPLPQPQIKLALHHARELVDRPREPRLLHGDFHHGNILQDGRKDWTIIDPKGLIAEQAFEIGPWIYNPIGINTWPNLQALFDTRLDIFSRTLGIDRFRLWQCAVVGCVLSDCWTLEGGSVADCHFNTVTSALLNLPEASS